MAKRRKLEAPSAADLSKLEADFQGEGAGASSAPPIAQVAGHSAAAMPVVSPDMRAQAAEVEAYREKEAQGLVLTEIPLEQINPMEIFRDRTVIDAVAQAELQQSIAASGVRLPIEVYPIKARDGSEHVYGLISGYRRLLAVQEVYKLTQKPEFATIKAIVRSDAGTQNSLAAMIEENEIRAGVSHYERGRIAAIAAQNGVFSTLEAAVNTLYPVASKAKRSKIRSFALVFEELGDLLEFPENMTEKQGLKLSAALREGHESLFRERLGQAVPESAAEEWAVLDEVITGLETPDVTPAKARGGRPKKRMAGAHHRTTGAGYDLAWGQEDDAYVIRVKGPQMDRRMLESLVENLAYLLDKPD